MATWKRDGRLTAGQRLGCAGLAGAVSLSATAPLEVITVLAQVAGLPPRGGRGLALWDSGRRLCRREGLGALWKGNLTACLRLWPYSAIQLASYRRFVMLFVDDLGHISQWSSIMAGSLAGIVAAIATYPTEVIKTRLIVQNRLEPSYKGILHALYMIYHQEGVAALYRGVSLSVLGAIPFSIGSFLVYTHLDKIWGEPNLRFTPLQNFINGCLAAGVAQTLSFPFETVKRKMQIVPYFGVMFSTFEFCKRVCLYRNGYIDSPLSYKLTPGVDQSLQPQELQEFKLLGKRNF